MNRTFTYFTIVVVAILALVGGALGFTGPASAHSSHKSAVQAGNQSSSQIAQTVFQALNKSRAAAGLPALAWNNALAAGAHQHNLLMASHDSLAHLLPGEPVFWTRLNQDGLRWSWAGENVGVTTSLSTSGALGMHSMMMNERPPAETGHRQNILSPYANVVGVDVVVDNNHHELWLTEDFARI